MRCTIPSRDQIGPETPLRLSIGAALAFPDGSMTACAEKTPEVKGRRDQECSPTRVRAVWD